MSTFTCPGCAQDFDRSQGVYAESGDFVCRLCQGQLNVSASDAVIRSEQAKAPPKQNIIRGAISALVLSIVSLFFVSRLLFFLLPLLSGGMAVATLVIPLRDAETRRALGWKLPISLGLSTVALLVSLWSLVLSFWSFDEGNGF